MVHQAASETDGRQTPNQAATISFTIRPAHADEAPVLAAIEAAGFPPAEAASLERISERLRVFPEQFFVAEADGRAVGFINGCASDLPELPDAYYADATLHRPHGRYAAVFGLVVLPEYRGRGIAAALLRHYTDSMCGRGKAGVILTCKEHLVDWYGRFGFRNHGIADSKHGGATWYDMKYIWAP
ncbi:GNAT family N-acetyltransferase [Kingella sp. SNUBH-2017]|uniref:GNAT family N-acetyltransferase n=1 Tax=Kingella sp. SNUBH-2017 TaxID=2994077 RepID=UPI0023632BD7|nr:GNAT family N-acetyltransferase [Kingella sp. SNUBH-2017]MDD2183366.1 GNAT family N-acetyltransferase [Kingella sp. SNUBH-2017]